ncbi:MAG TPA: glycosyl hydrolase family 18 protein [Pelobium sp.]|nr:glycosyl hydrolase family 18 protein [Pelobium sp.]
MTSCSKQGSPVPSNESQGVNVGDKALKTLATNPDRVVVGYMSGWTNVQSVADNVDLSIVTHINLSNFKPNSSGAMMSNGEPLFSDFSTSEINYVVNKAHASGRKVLASLGGGAPNPNAGDIAVLFRAANRTNFINNISAFLTYYNLDGIDIDVEGATLATIKAEQNYAPFVAALRTQINPLGKLITAASVGYTSGMIPSSSYSFLDWIGIMSYDNDWGGTGNHSTYTAATTHIQNFLNLGCPASKLVLGVPFYGYKPTVGTGAQSYKNLIAIYGTQVANTDYFDGYKYNGVTAIEAKTYYAAQRIKGVMIWELSQDVLGTYSLLQAVGRKINTPAL